MSMYEYAGTQEMRCVKIFRICILMVCVLSFLSGCAGSVALTKKDRSSLQTVAINKDVTKPDDMFYQGRKQSVLAGTFGLIGSAIAAESAKEPKSMLNAAMEKNNIDVRQIVKEQFENELKKSGLFGSVVNEKGDAEFKLSIDIYGFAQPHGLSSQLKPMLRVKGNLVRTDGSILWEKTEYVHNLSKGTPSHTIEEYLGNPELIREAFTVASKIVVSALVNDMRGE